MDFLKAYVRQQRKGILVFCLFCAIFFCVFALYGLPLGAVLYPAVLCGLLGGIFLFFDYRQAKAHHERLLELQQMSAELIDSFPPSRRIESGDYARLVRLLTEQQKKLTDSMNLKYREMIDYYTLWAHQIKTPIASMRLHLQNEDTALSRAVSEDLFRIEQYVEMVLCYLRLDGESTDYVFGKYDLDAVIKACVKKFAGQFARRKLRLEYEPVHYKVLTDEKWLQFVLEQILSNAIKYTEKGTVSISMETPGILCVRDTGMGIAPEDLPRIFEKGYTGCNGRVDKKASGIGLYLCRRICDNLNHTITVESVPDEGTRVYLGLEDQSKR